MTVVPNLHLITPPEGHEATRAAIAASVAAGARLVQVRVKSGTDRERFAVTWDLSEVARAAGAVVIVDDRVDFALAVGADGVHVGDDDIPVATARAVLGPDAIVGVTARTPEAGRKAVAAGATYLGVGPAYTTTTKDGLPTPIGVAGVAAVAAAVDVPVIAIAGVTPERVGELRAAGAHGVAVVGAVFSADDPARATADFVTALGEA